MDLSLTGLSHELVFDPLGSENICTTNKDIPSLFLLMTKNPIRRHITIIFLPQNTEELLYTYDWNEAESNTFRYIPIKSLNQNAGFYFHP